MYEICARKNIKDNRSDHNQKLCCTFVAMYSTLGIHMYLYWYIMYLNVWSACIYLLRMNEFKNVCKYFCVCARVDRWMVG